MRYFFLSLLLLLGLASCSKSSELFLFVKTVDFDWNTGYVEGNTVVRLNIFAESQSSVVNHVLIQTYTPDGKTVTILDSILAFPEKKLDLDLAYVTPAFDDTSKVEVRCKVGTQKGDVCKYTLYLRVLPATTQLETYDSKTMFSAASRGASAFSWETFEAFYPDPTTTSGLYFADVLSEDTVTLSCTWASESLLFARFEGFNFAQATLQSIQQAYNNSSPTNRINNIHEDDVILVGNSTGALGAIKVLLVSDKEGVEQDRYVFSVKAKK